MEGIRNQLYWMLEAEHPMTVRQVFYRAVSEGFIPKTEAAYKSIVVRLLGRMRRDGHLPYEWLSDSTRWMRKPDTHRGPLKDKLEEIAKNHRRAVWEDQKVYVEVWLEKEALAGVIYEETEKWDVPLMVTRGYPSLSYLYSAAEAIRAQDRPAYLYYIGDHDPSGLDIPRAVEEGLRDMAPDAEIFFRRIAVTPEQIKSYQLQTRPTKKTDSRSGTFTGESVEVDAIPPAELREIVKRAIEQHIDFEALEQTEAMQKQDRLDLASMKLPKPRRGA